MIYHQFVHFRERTVKDQRLTGMFYEVNQRLDVKHLWLKILIQFLMYEHDQNSSIPSGLGHFSGPLFEHQPTACFFEALPQL